MTTLLLAGLTMGVVGSFHCVGMCGPLALSLPLPSGSQQHKAIGVLLYNFGRMTTYALLGAIFGILGKSMVLFGFQQWLSVVLGGLILLFILLGKYFPHWFNQWQLGNQLFEYVRKGLGQLFFQKTPSSLFAIGLMNGLLPCGLVYIAIAAAIATGDIWTSAAFMAMFGLGTLPIMASVSFFGQYITVSIRKRIRTLYPYMMMLVASLLILRGMGLGIPYISPKAEKQTQQVHGCCVNPQEQKKP
jgi:sulfite exporter TauE/SafE